VTYTGRKQTEYMRTIREQFKARGLCQRCGARPYQVLVRNGYTREYTKCVDCLRAAALDQKLYKERLRER
jgi:ribosomal protein S14